jgi:AcrR family transcriptional regulator
LSPSNPEDFVRNREALAHAATAPVHREGPDVPLAAIAADAGVSIGTLYRHFRTREDLLNFLAHRSFEQVLANAQAAESEGTTASDALRRFIEAAIAQRLRAMSSPSERCSPSPGNPTANGTRHAVGCPTPT